jgi:hypothetical protein
MTGLTRSTPRAAALNWEITLAIDHLLEENGIINTTR